MSDYSLTQSRVFQWILISLVLCAIAGAFFYYRSKAAETLVGKATLTGLVGYWGFEEGAGTKANNGAGGGSDGTLANGPTWTNGKVGKAVNFDGSDDEVDVSSTFGIGTTNLTISNWVYISSASLNGAFVKLGNTATGYGIGVGGTTFDGSGNQLIILYEAVRWIPTGSSIGTGWHHVAMTVDGSGVPTAYLDGSSLGSFSGTGPVSPAGSTTYIGGYTSSTPTNRHFNGPVDEVRIYNRALTGTEISNLYQATGGVGRADVSPTSLLTNGLTAYWTFDGSRVPWTSSNAATATDSSGNTNTGTLTNMAQSTSVVSGKVGQALSFDGTDDYVDVGDMTAIEGVNAATFALWVKPGASNTDFAGMIDKAANHTTNETGMTLSGAGAGDTTAAIFIVRNGGDGYGYTRTGVFAVGQWTHIVGVFDGSQTGNANRLKIYVNGVPETLTFSGTIPATIAASATNMSIGRLSDGGYFNGVIDDTRVYTRALSASEVQSLYQMGNVTASSSSGDSLTHGIVGYWPLDEGSGTSTADGSGNANAATLTNGPTWTTGQIGSAVQLDGSDDVVSIGNVSALNFERTNAFSGCSWIFPTDTSPLSENIMSKAGGALPYKGWIFDMFERTALNATSVTLFLVNDASGTNYFEVNAGVGKISANNWYHVCFTYDGSSSTSGVRLYINGVSQTTTSVQNGLSATIANSSTAALGMRGGSGGIQPFKGKIDDARVYNRVLTADEVARLYKNTVTQAVVPNLVGSWSFNGKDVSGTTAYDRSSFGNNGTLTNGPTVAPGKVGQALTFDGSDDYVTIAHSTNLDIGGLASSYSVSAWFKTSTSTAGVIASKYDATASGTTDKLPFLIDINAAVTGQVRFGYRDTDATFRSVTSNASTYNDGQWHHVVAVRAVSGDTVSLFLDGVEKSQTSNIDATMANSGAVNIGVIDNDGTPTNYFSGQIDEVRVYNSALSAAEISALYNQGR